MINVRPQPGGAGTIVNNLSALGVGLILPIGFAGQDGEGFELWNALNAVRGVELKHFIRTTQRRTFTYCKPLLVKPGSPPVELNRLDSKNWTPTASELQKRIAHEVIEAAKQIDALIILDQVDIAETGVVTKAVLEAIQTLTQTKSGLPIIADSRRGLRGYPPVIFKMNSSELLTLMGAKQSLSIQDVGAAAAQLARQNAQVVFVSMAECGLLAAAPDGVVRQIPALPVRGEIDVVGAGDAVSANLATALAAGASIVDALELANTAASVVIHKLGTTGTASIEELLRLVCS